MAHGQPEIRCHSEKRLPADAVVIVEPGRDGGGDIYLSQAYPLDVVAAHLGQVLTVACDMRVGQQRQAG